MILNIIWLAQIMQSIYDVMEKVAIPIWDERISPVLDSAACLAVFDVEDDLEPQRQLINIPQAHFTLKAKYIADLKVDTILCGAISRPLRGILIRRGINVYPWLTGEVMDVLQAYLSGELASERFALPGCRRRGRYRQGRRNRCKFGKNIANNKFDQEEL